MNYPNKTPTRDYRSDDLLVIGWREIVALPTLGVDRIKAKIDTGARSSTLHALKIETFTRKGKKMVHFQVHPHQQDNKTTISTAAEILDYREVRNSGGIAQIRPLISTQIQLGEKIWEIELTLTNRNVMGFRMLLGRQGIKNKFLVDPSKSFLQSHQNKEQ